MAELVQAVKLVHILTVVFMSAPLYNLIVVDERSRFGKAPVAVDRYFENVIRGNSTRCYIFQLTAAATGILILAFGGLPLTLLYTSWVLLGKALLLIVLMILLSLVHFRIQPRIDQLLSTVTGDTIPPEIGSQIAPLRTLRRRLAAFCLFFVITIVVLAMVARFSTLLTVIFIIIGALFALRVYKRAVPYGWV